MYHVLVVYSTTDWPIHRQLLKRTIMMTFPILHTFIVARSFRKVKLSLDWLVVVISNFDQIQSQESISSPANWSTFLRLTNIDHPGQLCSKLPLVYILIVLLLFFLFESVSFWLLPCGTCFERKLWEENLFFWLNFHLFFFFLFMLEFLY